MRISQEVREQDRSGHHYTRYTNLVLHDDADVDSRILNRYARG